MEGFKMLPSQTLNQPADISGSFSQGCHDHRQRYQNFPELLLYGTCYRCSTVRCFYVHIITLPLWESILCVNLTAVWGPQTSVKHDSPCVCESISGWDEHWNQETKADDPLQCEWSSASQVNTEEKKRRTPFLIKGNFLLPDHLEMGYWSFPAFRLELKP